MIATASLDKQVLLWGTQSREVVVQINMKERGGIHTLLYSYWYQVIISCGYSTIIAVHSVDPTYFDVSLVGELIGHQSMLTSLLMIGKSPILASSDDIGTIKLWDIRTFSCIQSVNFGRRTSISKLVDMSAVGMLCFIGSRVNLVEFDEGVGPSRFAENYAFRFEVCHSRRELIVATRQEVQVLNVHTGRARTVLVGLVGREDEISQFRSANHFTRFFLADSRGNVALRSLASGERLKDFRGHSSEVLALKPDLINGILLTAAWDHLAVQDGATGELLRELIHFQGGKEVQNVELSVHCNVVLAAPAGDTISVIDYELFRVLGEVQAPADITALLFVLNYNCFLVATANGKIWAISFMVREQQEVYCDVVAVAHLQLTECSLITQQQQWEDFATKMLIHEMTIFAGSSLGAVHVFDLSGASIKQSKPAYERLNYNARRNVREDYVLSRHKVITQKLSRLSTTIDLPLKLSFQALKRPIQAMAFVTLDEKLLVVSSTDGLVKIFSLKGAVKAIFNVNHPLPLVWDVSFERTEEKRRKVIYALKIIDVLQKSGDAGFNISSSVSQFLKPKGKQVQSKQVVLLTDEYSPRDLHFEKARKHYQQELSGPSLKQMESQRRLMEAQNEWRLEQLQQAENEKMFIEREKEKKRAMEREQNLGFLDGYFHEKLVFDYRERMGPSEYQEALSTKLDERVGEKRRQSGSSHRAAVVPAVVALPVVQKKPGFFEYVGQKKLGSGSALASLSSTRLQESSISLSQRSSFKPSFYSRNPSLVDELGRRAVREQEWLVGQRKEREIVSSVLQDLGVKVRRAKNQKVASGDWRAKKRNEGIVVKETLQKGEQELREAKSEAELEEVVRSARMKAQVKLKLQLHLQAWKKQRQEQKYLD